MSMANKVAVITGASAGVGEATARQLAAQGATLVLAARTPGPLQALATELGATAVPTDVQQPADCQRLIDMALQQHGGIDLLVNNAGCNHRGEVREVGAELRDDPDFSQNILSPLEIAGLNSFGDSAIVIRARIKTLPGAQWGVGREMNRRVKIAFDTHGIEIPFPHQTIYFGEDKSGAAPPAYIEMGRKDPAPAPAASTSPSTSGPARTDRVDIGTDDGGE